MTDEIHEYEHDGSDDSRRSFAKKGALTAGALALGAGASSTASAQEDGNALIFPYHYIPNQELEVLAQLEQSITVDVLVVDGETVDEISQPDEYNGHVVRYDIGDDATGTTGFLFLRETSLSAGDTATLSTDASMFSPELNVLSVSIENDG